jgi:NAD(P)-dependent dehydrogenase (short-subunit alcohol dehydrogenase family)
MGKKTAFITGATAGIGYAIAEKLLSAGFFVYINFAHNRERAEEICAELNKDYRGCFELVQCDMSDFDSVKIITEHLKKSKIKLDYLVLNAGITDRSEFGDITKEDWERVINCNLSVPFFLLQNIFNEKLFADNASVLFIGSVLAEIPHSVSISYGVSKAAVNALALNSVKFLSPHGIRINVVEPGFVDTEWHKTKSDERRAKISEKIAVKRFASPHEIAQMCFGVLENTYMTGSVVNISGGYGLL